MPREQDHAFMEERTTYWAGCTICRWNGTETDDQDEAWREFADHGLSIEHKRAEHAWSRKQGQGGDK